MSPLLKRVLMISAAFVVVYTVADAQTAPPRAPDRGLTVVVEPAATPAPRSAPPRPLMAAEPQALKTALNAARSRDRARFEEALAQLRHPVARKIAQWALVDAAGETLSFSELDAARRELTSWPRAARRAELAEAAIETSGLPPAGIIQWFAAEPPRTASGVLALAAAYQASGRAEEATGLIRSFWRTAPFEAGDQARILARFSGVLTPDDHAARADLLLYGPQGPALQQLLPMLAPRHLALAQARMALRSDGIGALQLAANLPQGQQAHPGLAFERAAHLRRRNQPEAALGLAATLPPAPAFDDGASRVWTERRRLINAALKLQDHRAAYAIAVGHGLTSPADVAEAEFYAGWLALRKLNNPVGADTHFSRIQAAGGSPITQARAFYWRGRANEAQGKPEQAKTFYAKGADFYWTFYGQLAAEKSGRGEIRMGVDPVITDRDRGRFNAGELVQAAKILAEADEQGLFRTFVAHIDDDLPSGQDYALLADLAREHGSQDLYMQVIRRAAQMGFVMPERGYPVREVPQVASGAETALVFGITRQESGFDPRVTSSADARGMMQLLPSTAQIVARRIGVTYTPARLYEADYNMTLGSSYIGQLVDRFGGSYVLAIAGYNAGPGRSDEWIGYCGDPRAPGTDAVDFIECIPFSETRNYVMRVMEGMQVYRAKLGGGIAPATLSKDLKRGGYTLASASALQP